jgi:hypothetical protein
VLAVGLDNAFRIGGRGARRGGADPLRADLWLSFQHDFDRAGAGRLVAGSSAQLRPRLGAEASVAWDAGAGALDEGLLALRYGFADLGWLRSPYLSGRYRFLRTPPRVAALALPEIDQIDFGAGVRLAERLLLEYGIAYSLQDGARLSQTATVVYASRCQCFALGFDVVEDRTRDVYFRVRYSITGLGDRSGDPFAAARGLIESPGR